MSLALRATDRKSGSIKRRANVLLVCVCTWDLLRLGKIWNKNQSYLSKVMLHWLLAVPVCTEIMNIQSTIRGLMLILKKTYKHDDSVKLKAASFSDDF